MDLQLGSVCCLAKLPTESTGFLDNLAFSSCRHSLYQRTADDGAIRPPAAHLTYLISARNTETDSHWNS